MEREIWKLVPNTNDTYEASNLGNIRRIGGYINTNHANKKGQNLSFVNHNNGYKNVWINLYPNQKSKKYAHRIIASAFYGEIPEGMVINHLDGDRTNNRIDNLEICTQVENLRYSHNVLKTMKIPLPQGTKNGNSKFINEEIIHFRKLFDEGIPAHQIHRELRPDVHYRTIYGICKRKTWKHLI